MSSADGSSARAAAQPTPPINFRTRANQALRVTVFARDGYTCRACGWRPDGIPEDYDGRYSPIQSLGRGDGSFQTLHVDHIVPRLHGGPSTLPNLQTLCGSCNCRKSARTAA